MLEGDPRVAQAENTQGLCFRLRGRTTRRKRLIPIGVLNRKCESHLARLMGLKGDAKDYEGRGQQPQLIARKAAKASPRNGHVKGLEAGWLRGVSRRLTDLGNIRGREKLWGRERGISFDGLRRSLRQEECAIKGLHKAIRAKGRSEDQE
eukprot:10969583-Heterocapsa_arctica.AAC.1